MSAPLEPPLRSRALAAAAACMRWLAAATLGWTLLLALDAAVGRPPRGDALTLAARAGIALRWSLACSAVLAAPHVLLAALSRWRRDALGPVVAVVAVAAAWPAVRLADHLGSGHWISQQSWAPALRVGVAVGFVLTVACAWAWHVALVGSARHAARAGRAWAVARARQPLLVLAGLVAVTAAGVACARGLHSYDGLAVALLPLLWLGTATLVVLVVPRNASATAACAAVLGAACWIAFTRTPPSTAPSVARSRLTSLTARVLAPSPPPWVDLDVSTLTPSTCVAPPPPSRLPLLGLPPERRRNVVLICIDTLRLDAVLSRRDGVSVMPRLAELRAEAVDFRAAHSPYPATLFAVGGALSGRGPSRVFFAPEPPPTIFTLTRGRFDETLVVWPDHSWFRAPSVVRLFARGTSPVHAGSASEQVDAFLQEMRRARREGHSVLAMLHFFDLHDWLDFPVPGAAPKGPKSVATYYRAAAAIDDHVGRALDGLRELGCFDDSLIIVFADHGEGLGEHGVIGHHVYLTSQLMDVPLILRVPGAAPKTPRAHVSLLDIAPTVLHFVDVEAPEMDGRSLFLPPPPARAVFSEALSVRGAEMHDLSLDAVTGLAELERRLKRAKRRFQGHAPKVSVVRGEFRFIVDRATGEQQLYRWTTDPQGLRNVLGEFPAERAAMQALVTDWNARVSQALYCEVLRAGAGRD